jgi:hypothetical protein
MAVRQTGLVGKTTGTNRTKDAIMQTLENRNNYGVTLSEAHDCIRSLQPFHTGTLSGHITPDGTYYVQSYGVMIAWAKYADAEIAEDAYDYSVTTSKHANIVKKAWDL